jgi:hypothetical protein
MDNYAKDDSGSGWCRGIAIFLAGCAAEKATDGILLDPIWEKCEPVVEYVYTETLRGADAVADWEFGDYSRQDAMPPSEQLRPIIQTIEPTGMASAEAFGTPTVEVTPGPTGVSSGGAFATATVEVTAGPIGVAAVATSVQIAATDSIDRRRMPDPPEVLPDHLL